MIVKVTGIENFVGNIKRRYRDVPPVSSDPHEHHNDFGLQLEGFAVVDDGFVPAHEHHALIERLEADPRSLVADFVRTTDGRLSYRVWEKQP